MSAVGVSAARLMSESQNVEGAHSSFSEYLLF